MNLIGIGSGILICAGLCLIFWLQRDTAVTETITEERFVGEVRTLLKDYYPNTELTYNSETDTFAPTDVSIDSPRLFLGNLRPRTEDMSKSDRESFIRTFLAQVSQETDITPDMLRENLVMRNRTPEEFSHRQISMTPMGDEEAFEPIIIAKGEMLFEPVLDFDNALQPMNMKIMREQGFAFDEFVQLAGQNLLRQTPVDIGDHWERIAENIWISKLNDDYDAARLFLFPEHLALPVKGSLIAYAPSHAVCLITTNTDAETLGQMIELGNQSSETHRPLSRALWRQTEAGWKRMTSDDRNTVEGRASLMENLTAYRDQSEILDQHFARTQQDIHIAKVITRTNDKGEGDPIIETLSVFIGQGSYLPKTDFVVLGFEKSPEGGAMLEIEWDKFVEIIGEENLPTHPDYLPVRYMYMDELSRENINALRAAATEL